MTSGDQQWHSFSWSLDKKLKIKKKINSGDDKIIQDRFYLSFYAH